MFLSTFVVTLSPQKTRTRVCLDPICLVDGHFPNWRTFSQNINEVSVGSALFALFLLAGAGDCNLESKLE